MWRNEVKIGRIRRRLIASAFGLALVAAAGSGYAQTGNEWKTYGGDFANTRLDLWRTPLDRNFSSRIHCRQRGSKSRWTMRPSMATQKAFSSPWPEASVLKQTGNRVGRDDRSIEVDQVRIVDRVAFAEIDSMRIVTDRT